MVKNILIAFGVVISIFLMLFVSLLNGISIKNILLDDINIEELYLKYDKKLIVSIKKIKIKSSNNKSETKFDPNWLIYANDGLSYFRLIRIEDIEIENEHIFIEYKNNFFTIKHKYLEFHLRQKITNNSLEFNANTNKIKNIKFINNYVKLDESIQKLIEEQLSFEYIELVTLTGKKKLANITQIDQNDISLQFIIKKPKLKYPDAPLVMLDDISINVKNGKIDISILKSNNSDALSFEGKINTDLKNTKTTILGALYYKDIIIDTDDTIEHDIINYHLSSNKFKDIKVFDKLVKIPKSIRKWAIIRLASQATKIDNISGKIYLKKENKVDFSTLRVDATLYDIIMDFNPKKAYPLKAKKIELVFNGKDMDIYLTKPISNDVDLDGSRAVVYDMFGDSGLKLELKTISPLNKTLVRAVTSYGVNIANELGVEQIKGKSDIKVNIDVPFSNKPVDVSVDIKNKNSILTVKDRSLLFDIFHFIYKGKKVFIKNTTLVEKNNIVDIKNLVFDIKQNQLELTLDAYDLNKTFNINLTNSTTLDKNITKGNIIVNFVNIKDMVVMNNKTIPYRAKFGKDIEAILPSLGIRYKKQADYNYIAIDDIVAFEDMIIPLKQANLKQASIDLKTKDFNKIDLSLDAMSNNNDLNQTFDILLSSSLDINRSSSSGDIFVKSLKFKNFVDINNTNIPYNTNFKKDIVFTLPTLGVKYEKNGNLNIVNIDSFTKLSKVVKVMKDNNITKGSLKLQTTNFKDIVANINLDISQYGLFYDKKPLKDITLDVDIKNLKNISLQDSNNMLSANIDLTKKLKVDLKIDKMGVEYIKVEDNNTKPQIKEPLQKCEAIKLSLPQMTIKMKNGYLKYNDNLVSYDKISTKVNKDKVELSVDSNNTNMSLYLDDDKVYLNIDKLDKNFINSVSGKKIIKGGFLNLYINGTQCNLDGRGDMKNLNIKDAAILNNIFLVVNSAPALINPFLIIPNAYRFAKDEFRLSEYEIKKGKFIFNFNRDKSILDISKLNISGVYSDFLGYAKLDLYNEKIKSKIDIIFMKDYAKIISYIPLVNYIMLGDEKRFSYSVNIDGNLTSPDVKTHMVKETAMAPVNMIKRVFMLPLLPFRDTNSSK